MARNAIKSDYWSYKIAVGSHFVKKIKVAYWSEMARNAIESDFRSSKMAAGSHFVEKIPKKKLRIDLKWWEMWSKVIFGHLKWPPAAILWNKFPKIKLCIDLKWREMHSKVIFGHPKWPPAAILWKKIKVVYWSEMARNAIKSDFRSSKMAAAAILWKNQKNKSCVLIWNGDKWDRKWFSVIQNGRHSNFVKKKVAYWSEMTRNAIESDFRSSKMVTGSHFVNKIQKLSIDLKWREMRLVIQNGHRQPFCEKKSKLHIALKWREVRSKFIFGDPKWGGGNTRRMLSSTLLRLQQPDWILWRRIHQHWALSKRRQQLDILVLERSHHVDGIITPPPPPPTLPPGAVFDVAVTTPVVPVTTMPAALLMAPTLGFQMKRTASNEKGWTSNQH